MKRFFLLIFSLLLIGVTFAHQPRLVFDQPVGQIIHIQNPEVSQAFYGVLSGQDDIYQIISDTGFLLYVNIVVPKIYGSRTDFTVDIIEGNNIVYTRLDGKAFVWTDFFEPFAGDTYLQGPSLEKQVGSGIYIIRVANPAYQGKYSLAIGKLESFPLNETIHTYKVLPELKTVFFEKPWYIIFRNIIGGMLLLSIIIVILIIWGIIKFIKYKRRK
ncbi:MAG: hypothetical protein WC010_02050 [Candidatus Absconditabacterales bacterium]